MSTGGLTLLQSVLIAGARLLVRVLALGRVTVEGREHITGDPRLASGPLIVVANHASNLDPPLIVGFLGQIIRRRTTILAKAQLFRGPFDRILRAIGVIPVRTGGSDVDALRITRAALERGEVLLIFPEGTRSADGVVGTAHAGVAMLAARDGVLVLPVGLSGTDRLLGKGRTWPRLGTRITIRVGPPFQVTLDPGMPRRQTMQVASDDVMRRISDLVDPRQRRPTAGTGTHGPA
jgi:1-acyl-sn-glycerol-3-phosphate acyltransferase